jgi:hypothetical protein
VTIDSQSVNSVSVDHRFFLLPVLHLGFKNLRFFSETAQNTLTPEDEFATPTVVHRYLAAAFVK